MPPIHQTVKDVLVSQIRDAIIKGQFQPGYRLRQNELADTFGVSAVPVREALRELEADGLVSSSPRRGSIVTRLSQDDMQDIYDIRINLEEMATRIAVPRIGQAILTELAGYVAEMDHYPDHPSKLVKLNHDFHLTIYEASGRRHLCGLINKLRRQTQHYVRAHISTMNAMPKSQEQHRAILVACQQGNADEAARLMRVHLSRVGRELITYIKTVDS